MNTFCILSGILLLIHVTHAKLTVAEFGLDVGSKVYSHSGVILLQDKTILRIQVPPHVVITNVEVTVRSLSTPHIKYHAKSYKVEIKYHWSQLTPASYKIVARGFTCTNNITDTQYLLN